MVALVAAVVLALDAIPAQLVAHFAGVPVLLVVPHPEVCGLAFGFLLADALSLEGGEEYDRVAPYCALGVQLG